MEFWQHLWQLQCLIQTFILLVREILFCTHNNAFQFYLATIYTGSTGGIYTLVTIHLIQLISKSFNYNCVDFIRQNVERDKIITIANLSVEEKIRIILITLLVTMDFLVTLIVDSVHEYVGHLLGILIGIFTGVCLGQILDKSWSIQHTFNFCPCFKEAKINNVNDESGTPSITGDRYSRPLRIFKRWIHPLQLIAFMILMLLAIIWASCANNIRGSNFFPAPLYDTCTY